MKVLVTGATGFVGREITRQLQASGHVSRLLVREASVPHARAIASRPATELHTGNVLNANTLAPAFANCDAVIHLVGIISEAGPQTFERVHTDATRNLMRAAKQAGVKWFIHMSSLGTRAYEQSRYQQTTWAA